MLYYSFEYINNKKNYHNKLLNKIYITYSKI